MTESDTAAAAPEAPAVVTATALSGVVPWLERRQVALYLLALIAGGVLGLGVPAVAEPAEAAINPVLVLLLYATFLAVPVRRIVDAVRDRRFLATIGALNFLLVPLVVWLLTRPIADDRALLVGVLFVLLAPCIDYVIVFTGLGSGASDRLLAATPVLMLAQMVALPLYLWLFVGADVVESVEPGPFLEAFLLLILLPLTAAAVTQWVASGSGRPARAATAVDSVFSAAMVPLMMATLAVVVASQIHGVASRWDSLAKAVPVYLAFAVVMTLIGALVGRLARQDAAARRATVFTGVTRNSLVVLPLVLALPDDYQLAPLVVVTQTLVELLVMVALVRLVPRMVR